MRTTVRIATNKKTARIGLLFTKEGFDISAIKFIRHFNLSKVTISTEETRRPSLTLIKVRTMTGTTYECDDYDGSVWFCNIKLYKYFKTIPEKIYIYY